ncbi:cytochrome P450 [Dendrothele bispora CBS 962.96]|uniref:Cytochrome P450 n=1 Tax=Dendrothele bispora (strain CBS 962.96) TaxID=1314807 RepID=A0A4S8LNF0_DENBC|nr:cytochrome P450 [Dendrothele bispora CBS 962.96]
MTGSLLSLPYLFVIPSLTFCITVAYYLYQHTSPLPYPPGPKARNFLTGNWGQFPAGEKVYLKYIEWGRQYGSDLIHMEAFGQHYVVINSFKAANEILEKRALISSSRPFTLMDEFGGWGNVLGLLPYADRWRNFRKLFHQNFRPNGAIKFRPVQLEKIHRFLRDLLGPYDGFMDCVVTMSESIAFATMYGYDITSHQDHLPRSARQALGVVEQGMLPGFDAYIHLPFLRYLPSWFPGGGFKTLAKGSRTCIEEIKEVPSGKYSLVGELLHTNNGEINAFPDKVDIVKNMGVTTILASSDTTSSQIGTFILAMALYPDVQRKAQRELDQVIGTNRLPSFEDRPSLPYIEAVYHEVMRWIPVIPFGLPHNTTEPDVYDGYYIPKGTSLFANIWAMNHDENVYEDPDKFIPERHLGPNGTAVTGGINSILTYGFGRRVCVGRHVADATVWMTIACLLTVYDIFQTKDRDGKEIELDVNDCYHFGAFVFPKSFPCKISPRSESAERMIRDTSTIEYEGLRVGN